MDDSAVSFTKLVDYFAGTVGASVVHADDFEIVVALRKKGVQGLFDRALGIIRGNNYTY